MRVSSENRTRKIIEDVTGVMVSFSGKSLRSTTRVVVQEVKSGNGGIVGKRLGLEDRRALQANAEKR